MTASPAIRPDAPAIDVQGLCFRRGGEDILRDVTLEARQGAFLALLGPNGGGKTTLLRLILGLLRPDAGSVSVFGGTPSQAAGHMGYVPQYASISKGFPMSVLQLTMMGACRPGCGGRLWPEDRRAQEKALQLLHTLGLEEVADKAVDALSGGQCQRVLVARALMGKPDQGPFLLLLDEPTASIDQQGRFCFYEFLHTWRGKITTLLVSHDISMASSFFSHVALVNKTLTLTPGGRPSQAALLAMLGDHAPGCPVGQWLPDAAAPSMPGTDA
jgi:zinc transport system ATP-binding protein